MDTFRITHTDRIYIYIYAYIRQWDNIYYVNTKILRQHYWLLSVRNSSTEKGVCMQLRFSSLHSTLATKDCMFNKILTHTLIIAFTLNSFMKLQLLSYVIFSSFFPKLQMQCNWSYTATPSDICIPTSGQSQLKISSVLCVPFLSRQFANRVLQTPRLYIALK